ncbi:MAG: [FeFe] hydrogenase H-cluster radical SAM maturase HydE [Deltaproteobacteria bacterium HGW-Deltaproteobacteria-7]|jgi:biotin synthase|nr:MAG: [FeFe] hydrogenase H-cluster radical SAM maturase HydE [Deltaproteobacteria bacterium HGW-Deltaproteobacteria-7]PKN53164.1 MAG: [FeFe] hydrogenase H-cluster radical SAM maturase HydE [Deltaproteobacteria bacterium HGW-Deltaproteobacteria-13]
MPISKYSANIQNLIDKAKGGKDLHREDIIKLLKIPADFSPYLFAAADRVRHEQVGDEIYLRGIIEFSNYCERNCLYCGLRKSNSSLSRYRMSEDEIIATAKKIKQTGVPTVVLQSGEDSFYSQDIVCRLIERIRKETDLIITLSIGERALNDYKAFQQAGANRYLLKHETASRELYKYLRPGSDWENRLQCLRSLKHLGFETGTGNMVGLPGQTPEILADDLLVMKLLDADMLGIGPFIAHPGTPLAGLENDDLEITLRVLAVARLLTRNTNIPATTALATLHPQGRLQALQAGANVVMPDFTPEIYKSRYDIYPGRKDVGEASEIISHLERDFQTIGRTMLYSVGNRPIENYNGIRH